MDMGHLNFTYNFLAHKKMVFRINETKGVMSVKMSLPEQSVSGEPFTSLCLKIFSRHHGIKAGSLQILSIGGAPLPIPKSLNARITSELGKFNSRLEEIREFNSQPIRSGRYSKGTSHGLL